MTFLDAYELECMFPHCDSMILHKPGTCTYCDFYPNRQRDRIESNTNFSNENDPNKLPCPSTYLRPADVRDKWAGNRPYLEETK